MEEQETSKLKFSLSETGLERVLKHWEAETLRLFWELSVPMGSGKVYAMLKEKDIRVTPNARGSVSRASVIFFLNDMVGEGFLDYEEATGKGGHHRVYRPAECASNEEAFRYEVAKRVRAKVEEFLGE